MERECSAEPSNGASTGLAASTGPAASETIPGDQAAGFETVVKPFLAAHCLECHGEKAKAGYRVDRLSLDFALPTTADQWKEVIDRMAAEPDSDDYGRLTVMLAPWLDVEKLFDVGPGAFTPPPRVWSAVARLKVRQTPAFEVPEQFGAIVAQAFSQRRKTLRNSLKGRVAEDAWQLAAVDPGARPETLRPEQFAALARLAVPAQL